MTEMETAEQPQEMHSDITTSPPTIAQRLKQELALSSIHRNEVESHWRQILRKEKFQELKDEIGPLAEYHERNVKRKIHVIESTQQEFDRLQELYRKTMVANILRMDELITIHDDQMILLERDFRERVSLLQKEFHCDVERIVQQYDSEKDSVRQSIQKLERNDHYRKELLRQEQHNELEEIKNRNLGEINSLRSQLKFKVEEVEEQFEQAHSDFAQSTNFAKAAYEQLKAKDSKMQKDIDRKTRHVDRLRSKIQRFQLIAKQEEVQNRERQQALLQRKTRAIKMFQMTKDEMANFRKYQQQRLIVLSRNANDRKEEMRQQHLLAERVKKIATACQKCETSREEFAHVLRDVIGNASVAKDDHVPSSFLQDDLMVEESIEVNPNKNMLLVNPKKNTLLWNNTHHFWDKYNMAQIDVIALGKQVDRLKQKEQALRKKLKMYQDGITVNDDVLKDRNPLLVINGKMNIPQEGNVRIGRNGRKVMRRLTVVDGNHITNCFATQQLSR